MRDSRTREPIAGASVGLVGAPGATFTDGDGFFRLEEVAPGAVAIRVERLGYRSVTTDVRAGGDLSVDVEMEPSPVALAPVVVTGAVRARRADETLRPASVLAGDELQSRLQGTLAGALAGQPGVLATTMGPATARPVVRGLAGDRVLVLEDGARVGDVSGSGADHATALDATSARRVEVVRGPAAVLYGSNALGGVVNVIRGEIPSAPASRTGGVASLRGETASGSWGGGATATVALAERVPLRIEASGRRAGDLNTPAGVLLNTASDTWSAGAGTSYVADWGHAGASFRSYRNDYGIPGGFVGGHEAGVRIEMERASTKVRAVVDRPQGLAERIEFNGTHTWYRHREIEPPDILGTLFKLQSTSAEAVVRSAAAGPFSGGAVGARASLGDHSFAGGLHTPDSRRATVAAYVFQEMEFGALRIEGGLRYDWTKVDPVRDDPDSDIGRIADRTFGAASGSVGALYVARPGLIVGVNAGRAFRTPDVGELYSEGPHLAAYSFEVGNPSLDAERGTGVDIFLRYAGDRFRGELTGFRNAVSGYVYAQPTGRTSRVLLPVYQHVGNDAAFTGFEAVADWQVGGAWVLHGTASYVRGELRETGGALPLIPPLHGRLAVEHERPAWFARAEAEFAAAQDRVAEFEAPTKGYALVHAVAGVRFDLAGRLHVVTAALKNATNEEYRNHLSRVKEIMPEAGRGLAVTYRVAY